MAQGSKYPAVPQKDITSFDITSFGAGQFSGGKHNAPQSSFVSSKDVELDRYGYLVPRRITEPILPDTAGTAYQKLPVLINKELYIFTVDAGKVRYCKRGDAGWTDCVGSNTLITGMGGRPKLIRVLDHLLVLNGKNGDKLCRVDLKATNFPVIKYTKVADPTVAPTVARTNLNTGAFHIYTAYSYEGTIGSTLLSPITDTTVDRVRDQWSVGTPGSIKISRPAGAAPAGAQYWTAYIALAATAGNIQPEDMLPIATKLDLNTLDFVDNGTLDINLGGTPPLVNSTDGPKVSDGIVEEGNPILFADEDNPYNIFIGGGGPNALSFSVSDGGFRLEPEQGTNYYPTTIIGFRTGQGAPALTVLYSNTEGISKQATLEQQTVNYGDQSFSVWGVTEQHYGAAGVAAAHSAINYNGKLLYVSTNGVNSMETAQNTPNVLTTKPVSNPIDDIISSISNKAMDAIVGTGWDNKYMWLMPTDGFDTPQKLVILDTNNNGVEGDGAWYTLDIKADWIGVISPPDTAAFVYLSQGTKTLRLYTGNTTADVVNGVQVPFTTNAYGPLTGINSEAHNRWQANVQVMFNVVGLIGKLTIGVRYRNQSNRVKFKEREIEGATYVPSTVGGWGDPKLVYAHFPLMVGWGSQTPITESATSVIPVDKRVPVRVDDIMNESEWYIRSEVGYVKYKLRAISYEGITLGVRPDLQ